MATPVYIPKKGVYKVDGPRGYYAQWSKSETDIYSMLSIICGVEKINKCI